MATITLHFRIHYVKSTSWPTTYCTPLCIQYTCNDIFQLVDWREEACCNYYRICICWWRRRPAGSFLIELYCSNFCMTRSLRSLWSEFIWRKPKTNPNKLRLHFIMHDGKYESPDVAACTYLLIYKLLCWHGCFLIAWWKDSMYRYGAT